MPTNALPTAANSLLKKAILGLFQLGRSCASLRPRHWGILPGTKQKVRFLLCSIFQAPTPCLKNGSASLHGTQAVFQQPANALAGVTVMVTRPRHQAARLCKLIEACGGRVIVFPVLDIIDIEDIAPARALVARLEEFDLAIFVSANAVHKAAPLIAARAGLPAQLRVAVIGGRSAEALQSHGLRADIQSPAGFTSEALLALPEMHRVQGKNVVIFRGAGGRELLGEALTQRGAAVNYAEVYRRARPECESTALARILEENKNIIIVATSNEGLQNLFEMAGAQGQPLLGHTRLVVMSARNAEFARNFGMGATVVAEQTGDEGLLGGVVTAAQRS